MAERYNARDLDEPDHKVWGWIVSMSVLAFGMGCIGVGLDHSQWQPTVCGGVPCHWLQRSGALIVLCGTYLAFRSGAVIIKSLPPPASNPTQRTLHGVNEKASRYYGRSAFVLLLIGTLVWTFGDWYP
jgi:hypothetical protein